MSIQRRKRTFKKKKQKGRGYKKTQKVRKSVSTFLFLRILFSLNKIFTQLFCFWNKQIRLKQKRSLREKGPGRAPALPLD